MSYVRPPLLAQNSAQEVAGGVLTISGSIMPHMPTRKPQHMHYASHLREGTGQIDW